MAEEVDLQHIDALLEELRVIDPPEEFRRNAIVSDREIYARAEADPDRSDAILERSRAHLKRRLGLEAAQ